MPENSADRDQAGLTRGDVTASEPLARAALAEFTSADDVGKLLSAEVVDGHTGLVRFETTRPGYPSWAWTVAVGRADDAAPLTVLEAELLPGDGALLAPDWVPWSERLAEYKAQQRAEAEASEVEASDVDSDAESDEDVIDGVDGELDEYVEVGEDVEVGEYDETDLMSSSGSSDPATGTDETASADLNARRSRSRANQSRSGTVPQHSRRRGRHRASADGATDAAVRDTSTTHSPSTTASAEQLLRVESSRSQGDPVAIDSHTPDAAGIDQTEDGLAAGAAPSTGHSAAADGASTAQPDIEPSDGSGRSRPRRRRFWQRRSRG